MANSPNRRDRKKAATRAKLLAVARGLFLTHGYEGVSLRDVADAADYSTGAIFVHWNGKDDLFAEAMGRPHLTDARAAELLARLKEAAPAQAIELMAKWAA